MPESKNSLIRARVNFKIKKDLRDWVFAYAKKNKVNVTALIEDYFRALRDQHRSDGKGKEEGGVEQI